MLAVGCDPSLGVVHVDRMSRDSFALDLMEPIRPHVDSFVLDLLATQQFTREDFFETGHGWCKLMPSITRPLARTAGNWRTLAAPFAEWAATVFARSSTSASVCAQLRPNREIPPAGRLVRTPLTRANLRPSSEVKVSDRRIGATPVSLLQARCVSCGVKLMSRRRKYCDICLPVVAQRDRVGRTQEATANRKRAGIADGRSDRRVLEKRWPILVARQAEHRAFEETHGPAPGRNVFLTEITPLLRLIPIDVLIAATGLSKPMCYRIRRGHGVPHWRHWDAIRAAVANYAPEAPRDWERLASETYERDIEPVLRQLPTADIRAATGWSESYVSLVRHGEYVPHRRHWPTLLKLVATAKHQL